MELTHPLRFFSHVLIAAVASSCLAGQACAASDAAPPTPAAERDGRHDFDFNLGTWKTHIRRVLDPMSGTGTFETLEGTVTVRPIWDGRAQLEEIEADGPQGHWEGLTLFLYDPKAHQWNQTFIGSKAGALSLPLVGEFANGRGELFSQDTLDGRAILVRGSWSDITPDAHHFQDAYSGDGGKTWMPAFIANLTRISATASDVDTAPTAADRSRDFDFDLGRWRTHSRRLLNPLTGSTTWVEMDGETDVAPVWGGRANLAVFKADGAMGHVELLSLRWFNPGARQWSLDFATPGVGTLGVRGIGVFKDGRADFYDQEVANGKTILLRFSIWSTGADTARSEQAFSADGGKTWETNWVNEYIRIGHRS
jgi:hypothetical protein